MEIHAKNSFDFVFFYFFRFSIETLSFILISSIPASNTATDDVTNRACERSVSGKRSGPKTDLSGAERWTEFKKSSEAWAEREVVGARTERWAGLPWMELSDEREILPLRSAHMLWLQSRSRVEYLIPTTTSFTLIFYTTNLASRTDLNNT